MTSTYSEYAVSVAAAHPAGRLAQLCPQRPELVWSPVGRAALTLSRAFIAPMVADQGTGMSSASTTKRTFFDPRQVSQLSSGTG